MAIKIHTTFHTAKILIDQIFSLGPANRTNAQFKQYGTITEKIRKEYNEILYEDPDTKRIIKPKYYNIQIRFSIVTEICSKYKTGNCGEYSIVGYYILSNLVETKTNIHICKILNSGQDTHGHQFILITKYNYTNNDVGNYELTDLLNSDAYIFDFWQDEYYSIKELCVHQNVYFGPEKTTCFQPGKHIFKIFGNCNPIIIN